MEYTTSKLAAELKRKAGIDLGVPPSIDRNPLKKFYGGRMDISCPSKAAYHEMCEKIRYFEIDGKEGRALCHEREIGKKLDSSDDQRTVIVKNLPAEMKQAELHQIYQEYGFIVSLKISIDSDHKSLGYGYITFRDE
mmetsp:Transcript_31105/g.47512  ORF Transcript_31105/g.47512 Transcript_31105/m.47512 type:complete len:137 (+) Transcript_31105:173-583(+)